jgi:hypothetical protein
MRPTEISLLDLADVTGGCGHKHACPPPQQAEAAPPQRPNLDVTVATGAAGGQAIQQALQG